MDWVVDSKSSDQIQQLEINRRVEVIAEKVLSILDELDVSWSPDAEFTPRECTVPLRLPSGDRMFLKVRVIESEEAKEGDRPPCRMEIICEDFAITFAEQDEDFGVTFQDFCGRLDGSRDTLRQNVLNLLDNLEHQLGEHLELLHRIKHKSEAV